MPEKEPPKAAGWTRIHSDSDWWGEDGLLTWLNPVELKAFLYLRTQTTGRDRPWSVPAREVQEACRTGKQATQRALEAIRATGTFLSEKTRHDGVMRWYYRALEPEDWDRDQLKRFVAGRKVLAGFRKEHRQERVSGQQREGSRFAKEPRPSETTKAEKSRSYQTTKAKDVPDDQGLGRSRRKALVRSDDQRRSTDDVKEDVIGKPAARAGPPKTVSPPVGNSGFTSADRIRAAHEEYEAGKSEREIISSAYRTISHSKDPEVEGRSRFIDRTIERYGIEPEEADAIYSRALDSKST